MVRWITKQDLAAVARLHNQDNPDSEWTPARIAFGLRGNESSLICVREGVVEGVVVFRSTDDGVEIIRLIVDEECRRDGVGTELVFCLTGRLSHTKRKIVAEVEETNVGAQLFFKACGFLWTETFRSRGKPDCYRMEYTYGESDGLSR